MQFSIPRRWLLGGVATLIAAAALGVQTDPIRLLGIPAVGNPSVIGPTAEITEVSTGLRFTARVDTGAAVTSLHCSPEDLVIDNAQSDPRENMNKPARIRVENRHGESSWIQTRITGYDEVRSANGAEYRYRVRLPLRVRGVEKSVLVNLKDRSRMRYRVLLGRDFLRDSFLVDVSRGAG